jgi:hypothetical protein
MKCLLPFLLALTLSSAMVAQPSSATTQTAPATAQSTATVTENSPPPPEPPPARMFFPKDWYWGWAQFDLMPPHNEIDPNLCAANAGNYGGVNSKCNAFGRYMLSGTIELRPFGRNVFRRAMFFFDPNFMFGKNVPQTLYTWSWDGIGMEYAMGVGVDLPKRFQFRFTAHPNMVRFGSRDQPVGPAWLGPNGP